ncbi:MAG: hypothetical protein Q9224_006195, partial [Gallowayella concinna]
HSVTKMHHGTLGALADRAGQKVSHTQGKHATTKPMLIITSIRTTVEHIDVTSIGFKSVSRRELFKSLSPPLYGNHVLLDEIPRELLAILDCLYPRVSVDIELGGSLHECYQILKDYSCFHALDLAATVSSNGAQPHVRADFAISSIMRQASLTRLSVTCGPDWQFAFSNDAGDYKPLRLNEISLKSNEYAGLHVPSHRMLLRAFVDRNALKVIRIHRYWLIASVFDDIKSKLPNLQSVAIDGSNGKVVGPRSTSLMSADEYISVADFFRKTVLRAIAFHNITQRMPWVDLVATSGCKLTQLVIHTSYDDWLCAMSNWSNNFGGLIPPSSPFGVSQEELYQLNIMCPNIERLGVDISDLRVTEALMIFRQGIEKTVTLHIVSFVSSESVKASDLTASR